jgi:hypothetical protein
LFSIKSTGLCLKWLLLVMDVVWGFDELSA